LEFSLDALDDDAFAPDFSNASNASGGVANGNKRHEMRACRAMRPTIPWDSI
jgi:hypothetical protein